MGIENIPSESKVEAGSLFRTVRLKVRQRCGKLRQVSWVALGACIFVLIFLCQWETAMWQRPKSTWKLGGHGLGKEASFEEKERVLRQLQDLQGRLAGGQSMLTEHVRELEALVSQLRSEVQGKVEHLRSVVAEREDRVARSVEEDFIGQQYVASYTKAPLRRNDIDWPPAKKKLVLMWGSYYVHGIPPFVSNFTFDHCRVPNCEWTQDKGRFAEADALWFHLVHYPPESFTIPRAPPRPTPRQVWIASSQEWESVKCSEAVSQWDHYFNWTMSYKLDSDVWWPYGVAIRTPVELRKPAAHWDRSIGKIFDRKKKMVLFLSHKQRTVESRRLEYVRQLAKYIEVDIVGGNHAAKWLPDSKLFWMLRNEYKFVIAFENALCRDYISEKFWKIGLMYDAIPIVRNGLTKDDIKKVAPPGSYINAREFGGPRALASYLRKVASNKTLYESFFQWRKKYTLKYNLEEDIRFSFEMASGDAVNSWCKVCEKLHDPTTPHRTVRFSGNWCWQHRGPDNYATPGSQCSYADDLEKSQKPYKLILDPATNSSITLKFDLG